MSHSPQPPTWSKLENAFTRTDTFSCKDDNLVIDATVEGVKGEAESYLHSYHSIGIPNCKFYNRSKDECMNKKEGESTRCFYAGKSTTYYSFDREGNLYEC